MGAEFKIGDVVQLKSGGPKMTIIDSRKDNDKDADAGGCVVFKCRWFDGKKVLQSENFRAETLMRASTSQEQESIPQAVLDVIEQSKKKKQASEKAKARP